MNTGGITIHSALEIKPNRKVTCLSDKMKANMRKKLLEVKTIVTDEIYMASSDFFNKIQTR